MKSHIVGLLSIAFLLAACGDDDDDGGGGSAPPGATAVVTMDNAPAIAGAALESVRSASQASADAPVSATNAGSPTTLLPTGLKTVVARTMAISVGPETRFCTSGGSFTVSAVVEDPNVILQNGFSSGDEVSIDFSMCDESLVIDGVMDGGFDLTVVSFTGSLTADFSLDGSMTFRQFSVTTDNRAVSVDGAVEGVLSASGSTLSVDPSSNRLNVEVIEAIEGGEVFTATLFDFNAVLEIDKLNNQCALSSDGNVQSSAFTGEVSFDTITEFRGNCDRSPDSGSMQITGANGAVIVLTVLDSANVQLEVDLDGDGATDETLTRAWDQILPL